MNHRELLVLVVGVFMTIIAWMIIDIYNLKNKQYADRTIKEVETMQFKIDEKILNVLKEKQL